MALTQCEPERHKPAPWWALEREPWKRASVQIVVSDAERKDEEAVLAAMEFAGAIVAAEMITGRG